MSYRITYDEDADGRMILKYSGDAQSLVDACAEEARGRREHGPKIRSGQMDMRKMISADPVVMMQIAQQHGLDYFDPAIFEILKGRDYAKFRTADDSLYFRDRSRKTFIGG